MLTRDWDMFIVNTEQLKIHSKHCKRFTQIAWITFWFPNISFFLKALIVVKFSVGIISKTREPSYRTLSLKLMNHDISNVGKPYTISTKLNLLKKILRKDKKHWHNQLRNLLKKNREKTNTDAIKFNVHHEPGFVGCKHYFLFF